MTDVTKMSDEERELRAESDEELIQFSRSVTEDGYVSWTISELASRLSAALVREREDLEAMTRAADDFDHADRLAGAGRFESANDHNHSGKRTIRKRLSARKEKGCHYEHSGTFCNKCGWVRT